jgi:hypothetical protein
MNVHIVLLGSPVAVQVKLPEGTSFIQWCKNVKADGGIFADQLHIPYDKIIGMGVIGEGGLPSHFQNAPGTETKQ